MLFRSDKNLSYLLYLTSLVDIKNIKTIYDFGGGDGDLGYALKRNFPHLELYCTENDSYCEKILDDRGYKNFKDFSKIRLIGKTTKQKKGMLDLAHQLEEAGSSLLVLECIERELAKEITESISIPTIGIGSSINCDGQILVIDDMLGLSDYYPKFVKLYANIKKIMENSIKKYINEGDVIQTVPSLRFEKKFKQNTKIIHQFLPLDVPNFTNKFLNHWAPNLSIFIDSEIWPNLILQSSEKKIPLLLLNARITKKSFERWKILINFAKKIFGKFDLCIASNKESEDFLKILGAKNIDRKSTRLNSSHW